MNRILIFEHVEQLTYNYHSGGGLVVVAKDRDAAKTHIGQDENIKITDKEWDTVKEGDTTLDDALYIFPDAGCC